MWHDSAQTNSPISALLQEEHISIGCGKIENTFRRGTRWLLWSAFISDAIVSCYDDDVQYIFVSD